MFGPSAPSATPFFLKTLENFLLETVERVLIKVMTEKRYYVMILIFLHGLPRQKVEMHFVKRE